MRDSAQSVSSSAVVARVGLPPADATFEDSSLISAGVASAASPNVLPLSTMRVDEMKDILTSVYGLEEKQVAGKNGMYLKLMIQLEREKSKNAGGGGVAAKEAAFTTAVNEQRRSAAGVGGGSSR